MTSGIDVMTHPTGVDSGAKHARYTLKGLAQTIYIQNIQNYARNAILQLCSDVNFQQFSYEGMETELPRAIANNPILQNYFGHHMPPLLKGSDYTALRYLGQGSYGKVVLAQENSTSKLVVVKISFENNNLVSLLHEYMHQERTHRALRGSSCTAPAPLGFIRMRSNTATIGYMYLLVSEFCPVVPNAKSALTMFKAMNEHMAGRPLLSIEDWKSISLALIDATITFLRNDIYHNDIKTDNVMICFNERNEPHPVIIDYGLACRSVTYNTHSFFYRRPDIDIFNKHNGPELFLLPHPLNTSDLYSVAFLLEELGRDVGFKSIQQIAFKYRHTRGYRIAHLPFRAAIEKGFQGVGMDVNALMQVFGPLYPPNCEFYNLHLPCDNQAFVQPAVPIPVVGNPFQVNYLPAPQPNWNPAQVMNPTGPIWTTGNPVQGMNPFRPNWTAGMPVQALNPTGVQPNWNTGIPVQGVNPTGVQPIMNAGHPAAADQTKFAVPHPVQANPAPLDLTLANNRTTQQVAANTDARLAPATTDKFVVPKVLISARPDVVDLTLDEDEEDSDDKVAAASKKNIDKRLKRKRDPSETSQRLNKCARYNSKNLKVLTGFTKDTKNVEYGSKRMHRVG